jgi:hypothetical protein
MVIRGWTPAHNITRATSTLCPEITHPKKSPAPQRPGFSCAALCYLLLLLPDDLFSPPMLARLELPLLPRARSLCASLFLLLARAPLLAAWERLLLPEDFELRGAIDISFGKVRSRPAPGAPATRRL